MARRGRSALAAWWVVLPMLAGAPGCGLVPQRSEPEADWIGALSVPLPRARERNWPVPPARAERLLATAEGIVRERERVAAGITGAERFVIRFPDLRRSLAVKWKAAPDGDVDGWNNAPRKELAAYEIQKWFLPPESYVVPTTVARCIRLESYRNLDPDAAPTLKGTRCVFGVLSLWLENVEVPDPLYDENRFRRDPAYAWYFANFNLLTHLIDDRDTRSGNVLASTDPKNPRVFSVDNGISFGPTFYNLFHNEWKEIRVPALPRASIERLRAVTPEQVRALAVVAEFRTDETGMLRRTAPGRPFDADRGARFQDGRLQLGLTDREIEHVAERLDALLVAVEARGIPLF